MNELQVCVANQNFFQLQNALQFITSRIKELEYFAIAEINNWENGANSVSTIFVNGKSTFSNDQRGLPNRSFGQLRFDNLIFTDELFAEALHILSTCLSVNNKWSRKLVSLLQIMFNDNLKVKSVVYCVSDFNLLNC